MANIKISDLTSASAAADANEFEINEAGTSKKVTGSQIKAYVNSADGALAQKNTVATADIDNDAVTTAKILDANVTSAKIAADAIDGTKIADDSIDSEHIAADAIDAEHYAPDSVDATALNVTGNGTSGQVLSSDGDGSMTWTTIASGATLKVQTFSSPGTWTKPANTNHVKVTVVGGGGGGSPGAGQPGTPTSGGSSSFGAIASANGGAAMQKNSNGVNTISSGNGSVSSGTAIGIGQIPTAGQPTNPLVANSDFTYGIGVGSYSNFSGLGRTAGGPRSFTSSNTKPAANFNKVLPGAGAKSAGVGGYACSYAPVSGPVSVTVGVGGNPNYDPANQLHGKSGVVVVEWVE